MKNAQINILVFFVLFNFNFSGEIATPLFDYGFFSFMSGGAEALSVDCKFRDLKVLTRGGIEDTRLEAKAKDSLSEDRTSRGQGQECSRPRPRTEDTGASVLLKKKVFKNIFQAISNSLAYPKFLIKEGLNHKSHDMTSLKFFQRGSFCGTKIS